MAYNITSISKYIFQKDCGVTDLIPSQTRCGKFLFTCYDLSSAFQIMSMAYSYTNS